MLAREGGRIQPIWLPGSVAFPATRESDESGRRVGPQAGEPNPFVTGSGFIERYDEIVHHCLLAAETRTPEKNDWNVPAQP